MGRRWRRQLGGPPWPRRAVAGSGLGELAERLPSGKTRKDGGDVEAELTQILKPRWLSVSSTCSSATARPPSARNGVSTPRRSSPHR